MFMVGPIEPRWVEATCRIILISILLLCYIINVNYVILHNFMIFEGFFNDNSILLVFQTPSIMVLFENNDFIAPHIIIVSSNVGV